MASLDERDRRYVALRAMMQEQGWQALILAGNAEATQRGYVRYVSDWRLWGGKGFAVLPLQGEPALVLGAGSQSHWSKLVGWIDDVRPAQNMLTTVGEIVHALGLAQGEIGVVGMGQVMVYDDVLTMQRELPNARLVVYGNEARHEILREADEVRNAALAEIDAFLDQAAPAET